ncbi:hypothetical protein BO71DRAFT_329731, partial [Aspergillus ellipticus CBS 707.79]
VPTLRRQSPFLLLCIMTACLEHNPSLQQTMEEEVRKAVAHRVVVNNERSMDILQGLLVHLSWYHYHWHASHTQAFMLTQMAIVLVVDLGLDRDENFKTHVMPCDVKYYLTEQQDYHHSPTGQRALLGCHYLCFTSSLFRRQLTIRSTKWMDKCTETLAQEAEYPTDLFLRTYVDIESLARTSQSFFEETAQGSIQDLVWKRIFESMETQQNRMEKLLSQRELSENWALQLELYALPTLVLGQALGRQRYVFYLIEIKQLSKLTYSAYKGVTTFLAIPATVAVHLPTASFVIIWHSLMVLSKLSLIFGSQTEIVEIRKKTVHDVGLALMRKLDEMSRGDDVWANCKRIIGSMVSWLENSKSEPQRPQTSS